MTTKKNGDVNADQPTAEEPTGGEAPRTEDDPKDDGSEGIVNQFIREKVPAGGKTTDLAQTDAREINRLNDNRLEVERFKSDHPAQRTELGDTLRDANEVAEEIKKGIHGTFEDRGPGARPRVTR